ncbi:sigma-54 factor interaction domain-containing protein, partial [Escherichia coli]|uniref:sigma-54 factor interaction domain-containing protein n=1 Tax=Escherichia coli TaxID=562 RepID=UPI00215D7689
MSELIATAASSINAFTLAKRVAAFNVPVLIQGETGAGKECVAKYIHTVAFGENDNAPYIGVNCAAIPENMLEATLFGYDKGAFTGAIAREGANKQVISSQADSLIKISRIWAD